MADKPDDLETEYELRVRGKRADLVELANVIYTGAHAKHYNGDFVPPDARMIRKLIEQLDELLDFEAANREMEERLLSGEGGPVTGEALECSLTEPEP